MIFKAENKWHLCVVVVLCLVDDGGVLSFTLLRGYDIKKLIIQALLIESQCGVTDSTDVQFGTSPLDG